MGDTFVDRVDVDPDQATIDKINSARSPFRFVASRDVDPGAVVGVVFLELSRALTAEERAALRAQIIQLGEAVEPGLIGDLKVAKGCRAFRTFAGRKWTMHLQGHLRTEELPEPAP